MSHKRARPPECEITASAPCRRGQEQPDPCAGANRPIVIVELKLPRSRSPNRSRGRRSSPPTRIVDALTIDDHNSEDTWVNILHADDGAWGIGGQAEAAERRSIVSPAR